MTSCSPGVGGWDRVLCPKLAPLLWDKVLPSSHPGVRPWEVPVLLLLVGEPCRAHSLDVSRQPLFLLSLVLPGP